MNKVFRCKITVQGIALNHTWKAMEDGDAYHCTNLNCVNRTASPRYKLPIIAADGNATVEMVFFGDVDRDVVGRPADQVLESFLANSSVMPAKIMTLVGRKYIVEVTVSKYSCRRDKDGLSFPVLKFFTEAGFMYHDFVVGVGSSSSAPMQQVPFSGGVHTSHAELPQGTCSLPVAMMNTVSSVHTSHAELPQDTSSLPNVRTSNTEFPQGTSSLPGDMLGTEMQNPNLTNVAQLMSMRREDMLQTQSHNVCTADVPDKTKVKETKNKRSRWSNAKSIASKNLFVDGSDTAGHRVDDK
ncbi:hypothetical protein CFC21_080318 [Triticum aestivum]|uniref:Replication factor A C-terminal domain-containing protein n=2 Tax=Triticum aestivum TaxID=4565 RepID=A0A9R1I1N1_WHEAT|nr:uncharacterized protein LOC123125879 [Triticum aestivum]KAF7075546.1 hypothetical protein CFC21_080312 [Triticum aestivum]KAF7075552.1 hypothetical protein CFC21_080318 [Triticum aestivum]